MIQQKRRVRLAQGRERGATMLELAFSGLTFFICVFAVIEAGRLFFVYNALTDAVRRGTRYGALAPRNSQLAVKNMVVYGKVNPGTGDLPVAPDLDPAQHVQVTYTNDFGISNGSVKVRLTGYQFNFNIPIFAATWTLPTMESSAAGEAAGSIPGVIQ